MEVPPGFYLAFNEGEAMAGGRRSGRAGAFWWFGFGFGFGRGGLPVERVLLADSLHFDERLRLQCQRDKDDEVTVLGCKVVTLLFDWTAPEARGLGCGGGAPFSLLRTVCGVAGAEVALGAAGAGEGPREEPGSRSEEEQGGEAASPGEQMEGSDMLLVKAGGWFWFWSRSWA